jgi:hypothetical protein
MHLFLEYVQFLEKVARKDLVKQIKVYLGYGLKYFDFYLFKFNLVACLITYKLCTTIVCTCNYKDGPYRMGI